MQKFKQFGCSIASTMSAKGKVTSGFILLGIFFFVTLCTVSAAIADTTIYACVQKKNSVVRIVDTASMCTSNESPLQWNTTGPQGPTGATGPQGVQGEQGIQGIPGVTNGVKAAFGAWITPEGGKQLTTHPGSTVLHLSPGHYNVRLPTDLFYSWAVCTVSPYDNANTPLNSCTINGTALVNTGTTYQTVISVQCRDTTNNLADSFFHLICVQ